MDLSILFRGQAKHVDDDDTVDSCRSLVTLRTCDGVCEPTNRKHESMAKHESSMWLAYSSPRRNQPTTPRLHHEQEFRQAKSSPHSSKANTTAGSFVRFLIQVPILSFFLSFFAMLCYPSVATTKYTSCMYRTTKRPIIEPTTHGRLSPFHGHPKSFHGSLTIFHVPPCMISPPQRYVMIWIQWSFLRVVFRRSYLAD